MLIYGMVNAVLFGAGAITVLSFPSLQDLLEDSDPCRCRVEFCARRADRLVRGAAPQGALLARARGTLPGAAWSAGRTLLMRRRLKASIARYPFPLRGGIAKQTANSTLLRVDEIPDRLAIACRVLQHGEMAGVGQDDQLGARNRLRP